MKFRFDPNQDYQLQAIASVADLFKGQTPASQQVFGIGESQAGSLEAFSSSKSGHYFGYGNRLSLNDKRLNKNLKAVQNKNLIISQESIESQGKNFSVEMETGTGKTYIYLRTIFELNKRYGFKKFIIVVPSVAVREGVLKSIEVMRSHFNELYNKIPFKRFIYNSRQTSILRGFARGDDLQMMIINIDAFNKDSNIIRSNRDHTRGLSPLKFIKETRPILIIDEAQNMESEKSKQAISSLNPLVCLRYSATHRHLYNPVYCLNPVQAFQKKLVKKISVVSVVKENDPSLAYIKVLKVINQNNKITCHLQFFKNTANERKLIKRVCGQNDDLFILSNENPLYRNGFKIIEINCKPGMEFVRFANSVKIALGQEQSSHREEIIKIQIKETVKAHFEKELQLKNQGIKVLSLFFLDRVENYRIYKDSGAVLGLYGKWFEEIYNLVSKEYKEKLNITPVSEAHNGYFSKDKRGILKNTKGAAKEDSDTYNLIMRDKERLLDINNPLKFIFSHSALREGWDNPNIFQICTLNETISSLKKRQEIGRGLRLAVNQKGERARDDLINNLAVVANESYSDFVSGLQKEIEEDGGFIFNTLQRNAFVGIAFAKKGKDQKINLKESRKIWEHIKKSGFLSDNGFITDKFNRAVQNNEFSVPLEFKCNLNDIIRVIEEHQLESHIRKHKKVRAHLKRRVFLDPEFKKFWKAISQKTFYSVYYSSQELIEKAGKAIKNMKDVQPISIEVKKADIELDPKGAVAQMTKTPHYYSISKSGKVPDILDYIQKRVYITKRTVFNILKESGRLSDFLVNPQQFMDFCVQEIKNVLHSLVIEGIQYEKLDKVSYEVSQFEKDAHKMEFFGDKIIPTEKSVYDYIYYESGVEKRFATALEKMSDIKYFIKLPGWFKVPTPVGDYNPDWAILKKNGKVVYMIRETKAALKDLGLRGLESAKIKCGQRHFESIGVNYKVCSSIENADL